MIAGLVLGFAGLMLLVGPGLGGGIDLLGAGVLMIASLCLGLGLALGQRAKLPESPLLATACRCSCGGGLLLLASALTGEPARFDLAAGLGRSLLALGYLMVFGAIVAFTAYVWLLRVASPVLVSTYAYVNPVVAVLLGWAFAGEPLTRGTLIAAAVILTGVALISSAQGGHKQEEKAPAREEETASWEEAEVERRPARRGENPRHLDL